MDRVSATRINTPLALTSIYCRIVGSKSYELTEHLGNVRSVVREIKLPSGMNFTADLKSSSEYYPFGMAIPARGYQSAEYRYGYNGKEKDDEVKGEGNSYDYGARVYDSRVGRWLSLDPLQQKYPSLSPYVYVSNTPIVFIDPDGNKEKPFNPKTSKPVLQVAGTQIPIDLYNMGGRKIRKNPNAYNCHSFAWHNSKGDPNNASKIPNYSIIPLWDNDPTDDIIEQRAVQLHSDVRNVVGDRVIYYQDVNGDGSWQEGEPIAHSAVVNKVDNSGNTVTVEAKMGQGGMSVNHPAAPGYYETNNGTSTGNKLSRSYFRVNANMQKVGNIDFDSNTAKTIKDNTGAVLHLVVQDVKTGKDYNVTRQPDGSYKMYTPPTNSSTTTGSP